MTGQLAAYLFGMAVGLLAGAVGVGSLLRHLDRQIDAAVTWPRPEDRTERIPRGNVRDLPRRRLDQWV